MSDATNRSLGKEQLRELLESGEITINEVAEVIGDYASCDTASSFDSRAVLDSLSGWIIDDELAVNWGINTLVKRIGNHGYEVMSEILTKAMVANMVDQKCVCSYISSDCIKSGCTGTADEWYNRATRTGEKCSMRIEPEAYECPICNKGILNPSFNGKLACDKCSYDVDYHTYHEIKKEGNTNEC